MPSLAIITFAFTVVIFAGGISGMAGFGFSLVAVPLLLLVFPPASVVATTKVLTLATAWVILAGHRQRIESRVLAELIPSALVGLLVGLLILHRVDVVALKLLASAIVVAFALLLALGWKIQGIATKRAGALAGFASGTFSMATGLSGPPVVVLFTGRSIEPTVFRVTMVAYFACIDVVGLSLLAATGSIDSDDLLLAAALIPAAIAGRWGGRWLAERTSPERFRQVTLWLLAATGASGIATAILALTHRS